MEIISTAEVCEGCNQTFAQEDFFPCENCDAVFCSNCFQETGDHVIDEEKVEWHCKFCLDGSDDEDSVDEDPIDEDVEDPVDT